MRNFNKKLAATAAIAVLTAGVGAAWAQGETDPQDTPQANTDMTNGAHIYHFKNEGASPETDPAAHLILLKPAGSTMPPVAVVQQTTTVAQTDAAPAYVAPVPATTDATAPTDTTPAPSDTTSTPAPKADRN